MSYVFLGSSARSSFSGNTNASLARCIICLWPRPMAPGGQGPRHNGGSVGPQSLRGPLLGGVDHFWLAGGFTIGSSGRDLSSELRSRCMKLQWRALFASIITIVSFMVGYTHGLRYSGDLVDNYVGKESTSGRKSDPTSPNPAQPGRNQVFSPLRRREDLGALLESEGFQHGAELGVQKGLFSQSILESWPSCETYLLVDLWAPQPNYRESRKPRADE